MWPIGEVHFKDLCRYLLVALRYTTRTRMSRLYHFFLILDTHIMPISHFQNLSYTLQNTLRSIPIMDEMTFVDTYLGHAGLHVRNVSNNIYPQIPSMAKVTRGNGL